MTSHSRYLGTVGEGEHAAKARPLSWQWEQLWHGLSSMLGVGPSRGDTLAQCPPVPCPAPLLRARLKNTLSQVLLLANAAEGTFSAYCFGVTAAASRFPVGCLDCFPIGLSQRRPLQQISLL